MQLPQYGRLLAILELFLDPLRPRIWKDLAGSTILLAVITPCKTKGEDATQVLTMYKKYAADIVIDVNAVEAVVGRVRSRKSWGIVDRSSALARTVFSTEHDGDRGPAEEGDDEPDDLPQGSEEEEDPE